MIVTMFTPRFSYFPARNLCLNLTRTINDNVFYLNQAVRVIMINWKTQSKKLKTRIVGAKQKYVPWRRDRKLHGRDCNYIRFPPIRSVPLSDRPNLLVSTSVALHLQKRQLPHFSRPRAGISVGLDFYVYCDGRNRSKVGGDLLHKNFA